MSDENIKQIFARNLKKQLELHGKQPVDIVNELHIPFSTVSNWVNAVKFPRMGKVELLASYFGIEKSDLIEDKPVQQNFAISDFEKVLIIEYRKSDDITKEMVQRILNIRPEEKENMETA